MKTVEGKVVFLGSQGVGKTSIITKYIQKSLADVKSPTIGASFFSCKINSENATIILQVWDTAGQERYRSMAPMYYRNTNAAFLIFDITQYDTFEAIKSWVTELKRNVEGVLILVVIGNKIDLAAQRVVDSEEAKRYAISIGAIYYETSAFTDEGIDEVMSATAMSILKLSQGETNIHSSLKIYDDSKLITDVPLNEEELTHRSIAHGIHIKPYFCC